MSSLAFPLAGPLGGDSIVSGLISLTPVDGSLLSSDPKTARFTPIAAQIQCDPGRLPYVFATVGSLSWLIYDGVRQKICALFGDHTSVVDLGSDQFSISVLPNGGWWRSSIEIHFISGGVATVVTLAPSDGAVLNLDPEVARVTPILAHVQCVTGETLYSFVTVGSHNWEMYDGTQMKVFPFFNRDTLVSDLGGDEFLISALPNGGWWRTPIELQFISGKELI